MKKGSIYFKKVDLFCFKNESLTGNLDTKRGYDGSQNKEKKSGSSKIMRIREEKMRQFS